MCKYNISVVHWIICIALLVPLLLRKQNLKFNTPYLIALRNFSQPNLFARNFYVLVSYRKCDTNECQIKVKYMHSVWK